MKCECDTPSTEHEGLCEAVPAIAYERDGFKMWLCVNCVLPEDKEINS